MKSSKHFVPKLALHGVIYALCFQSIVASEVSDLGSPSQEIRDRAAKTLRETYVPPARTNWDGLMGKLKTSAPKTNVMEILGSYTNNIEGGGGSGNTEGLTFRLDDLWLLECSFSGSQTDKHLTHFKLIEQMRRVWVEPPANFTGKWINYYVNGQKCSEGNYRHGRAEGDGLGFYSDGSMRSVLHWVNGVADGEETAFYPSGKIKYKGSHQNGKQVGVWTWYNEDGSVKSTKDFSKLPERRPEQ